MKESVPTGDLKADSQWRADSETTLNTQLPMELPQAQQVGEQGQPQYYYDSADGNYYTYEAGDGGGAGNQESEAPQNYYYYQDGENVYAMNPQDVSEHVMQEMNDNGGVPITPSNMRRAYEYEYWAPPTHGWFIDAVTETFLSLAFRVYFTFLMYCAGVLLTCLSLNWIFAVLFRMFAPPDPTASADWQALSFFAIFLFLSFTVTSAYCTWVDMLRCLWAQTRDDMALWGMSHKHITRDRPPYVVYLVVVIVTVFLPLLWGLIAATVEGQSLLFFAQTFSYIAVIVVACLVAICYIWFYWRAVLMKTRAFRHRLVRDEFTLREKAYRKRPGKLSKTHWYHASTVLEEYGLDGKTVRWTSVVFTVGCVPLFALYAAHAITTLDSDPSVVWPLIATIAFMCLYIVSWMTLLYRKSQWSVYAAIFLIAVIVVLGVIGAGLGGNAGVIGVVLVLFAACQAMLTRKRKHELTRKEICALLNIPLDRGVEQEKRKRRIDTYLCCCRNTLINYLRCFDVKTLFGYKHPAVRAEQKRIAIHNVALRTDHRALICWWLLVMFAIAFTIAIGNTLAYRYTRPIAATTGAAIAPHSGAGLPFCSVNVNRPGGEPLRYYDLALLTALGYTFGTNGATDYGTWFSHNPSLVRRFPRTLPPNLNLASHSISIPFMHYADMSTDVHIVTLNSNSRGLSLFRNMDDWGEAIALQIAGVASPIINIWAEKYRKQFISGSAFLKRWLRYPDTMRDVTTYVRELLSSAESSTQRANMSVLLVGDQFNGGYVKWLAAELGLPFVVFNPPGTRYTVRASGANGVQLSLTRGVTSYIDSLEDVPTTFFLACGTDTSSNRCSRIETMIQLILEGCGDDHGRIMA